MFKSEVKYVLKTVIHGYFDTVGYETLQGFSTDINKAYKFSTVEDAQAYRNGYAKGRGYTLAQTFMVITPIEERAEISIQEYVDTDLDNPYSVAGYSSEEFEQQFALLRIQCETHGVNLELMYSTVKEGMIKALAMTSYERDKGALDFAHGDWKGYLTFEPLCSDYVEPEKPVSAVKPDFDADSLDRWAVHRRGDDGNFITVQGEWINTPTYHPLWQAKEFAESEFWLETEILSPEDVAILMNPKTYSQSWDKPHNSQTCDPAQWYAGGY